ncbi:MAG: hypothetical protein WC418_05680, partial [Candidatus Omnitrophota bacterium]
NERDKLSAPVQIRLGTLNCGKELFPATKEETSCGIPLIKDNERDKLSAPVLPLRKGRVLRGINSGR